MKKNQRTLIACGALGLLGLGGILAVFRLNCPQPPQPQASTPEQTVEYLASNRFVKAGRDEKQQYIRQIHVPDSNTPMIALLFNPRVSAERRRRVMENILPVMEPVINQRLDEFEKLPPAQKIARLDAIIDQLQAFRQSQPETMSTPQRLNLILQHLDPHTRARLRQHLPAMRARMKQRGIPSAFPL